MGADYYSNENEKAPMSTVKTLGLTQPMYHLKNGLLYQYLTSPKIFQQGQQVIWIDPFAESE